MQTARVYSGHDTSKISIGSYMKFKSGKLGSLDVKMDEKDRPSFGLGLKIGAEALDSIEESNTSGGGITSGDVSVTPWAQSEEGSESTSASHTPWVSSVDNEGK